LREGIEGRKGRCEKKGLEAKTPRYSQKSSQKKGGGRGGGGREFFKEDVLRSCIWGGPISVQEKRVKSRNLSKNRQKKGDQENRWDRRNLLSNMKHAHHLEFGKIPRPYGAKKIRSRRRSKRTNDPRKNLRPPQKKSVKNPAGETI